MDKEAAKKEGFDWIIGDIHKAIHGVHDDRRRGGNFRYELADAGLGAFSLFFSLSPSFLAYQKLMDQRVHRNNARSLFGINEIPSDNQIRTLLDRIEPSIFFPVFDKVFGKLEESGHLDGYRYYDDRLLIPIDGTEYHRSSAVYCRNCTEIHHKNGRTTYSHKILTPVVAAPGNTRVIPLDPEFIIPQDGSEKQDCELNAAKRWISRHASLCSKAIILGDDLFSREPFCRQLQDSSFHFIFVCKPDSHKTLYDWIGLYGDEVPTFSIKKWNGHFHEESTYRYMNQVPIKDGDDPLAVNWLEIEITRTDTGQVLYRNSFVTDDPLDRDNVPLIATAGRARWKVENENTNVLKNKGYHLEHNFGHGEQLLSTTLLTLNLLAFLAHTFLDFIDTRYTFLRKVLGARKTFFNDFSTLTKYFFYPSWDALMDFMIKGLELKHPVPG